MPLLLDTGILYALADRKDGWHRRSRDLIDRTREALIVPVTVVPEVCYVMRERLGILAEQRFVESLAAEELAVEELRSGDMKRCAALLERYPEIGFVDASVVAIAERLHLRVIATTDRRHFGAIRPKHVAGFELVP
jgi:predicted nucleic acid-binding protein